MSFETLIPLVVPLAYALLLFAEMGARGRSFPKVRYWTALGIVFFAVLLALSVVAPLILPIAWLEEHRVFDLTRLGLLGVIPALLTTTFVNYWLHRAEHRFDWMWRSMHQLHHSALRVDIAGAFITHPTEMIVKLLLGATIGTFVLGLDPAAVALASTIAALLSMFQHWNVRTPRWLGFLVQRPESHCLHHERGVHARNFGDLPLWDMIFGTYANPRTFEGEVGFDESAAKRFGAMLLMRDVSGPAREGA